jgi:hypothetical protein
MVWIKHSANLLVLSSSYKHVLPDMQDDAAAAMESVLAQQASTARTILEAKVEAFLRPKLRLEGPDVCEFPLIFDRDDGESQAL